MSYDARVTEYALALPDIVSMTDNCTAQRYVSMELFYTPGISQQYKPRDFVPSTIDTLALPGAEDWERETMALTPLDAHFHG